MMRSGRARRSSGGPIITRTGTRLSTPATKPRPCIVRLEKIPQKKSSFNLTTEETKKPLASATKNTARNVILRKVTTKQIQSNISPVQKNLSKSSKANIKLKNKLSTPKTKANEISMTGGRSKRTPKPNPKYQNESLVTSFNKNKTYKSDDNEDDDDDDDDDEQLNATSDEDEEFTLEDDHKDSSDEEIDAKDEKIEQPKKVAGRNQIIKGKITTGNHPTLIQFTTSTSTSNSSIASNTKTRQNVQGNTLSSTSNKNNINTTRRNVIEFKKSTATPSAMSSSAAAAAASTTTTTGSTVPRNRAEITNSLLRKRKLEFEKERELLRKRMNLNIPNSIDLKKVVTSTPTINSQTPGQKQNTTRQQQQQPTFGGMTISSQNTNKITQIYNNKLLNQNNNKISPAQTKSPAQQNRLPGQTKSPAQNIHKISSASSTNKIPVQGINNKLIQMGNRNSMMQQQIINKSRTVDQKKSMSPILRQKQPQNNLNGKNMNQQKSTSIKIINKKPIEIEEDDEDIEEKNADPFADANSGDIDDFESMPTFTIVNINDIIGKKGDVLIEKSTQDNNVLSSPKKSNDFISPSRNLISNNNNNNRRKPPQVQSIPEKGKANKSTPPPVRKAPEKQSPMVIESSTTKGPPRILNSGVVKKPITSLYSKNNDFESSFDKLIKSQQEKAKENVSFNNKSSSTTSNAASDNTKKSSPLSGIKRKLPSEKVIIQRQGNKIIKKITCFETWYVINIPETKDDEISQKNTLELSLMKIANSIKSITLPSNEWTCKVSLQKMNPAQLASAEINNVEKFTGDVGDPSITSEDKYKYQPINVMFRRSARTKNVRMPFDRAVIFKNNTFFTNIEGKNVKLVGSPNLIKCFQDIEILLQIVDDMTLISQFVEPATYIP